MTLKLFGRTRSVVPDVLNQQLPAIFGAAARQERIPLQRRLSTLGLFEPHILPFIVPVSVVYAAILVKEAMERPGGPNLDELIAEIATQRALSPVEISDSDSLRFLERLLGGEQLFDWDRSPSAFGLRDLVILVVIGSAAIRKAKWRQDQIDQIYGVARSHIEARRITVPVR